MSEPFAHLVVLDVATLNAAPQIATFFGDLGARVIKVEHPRGDPLRQLLDADGNPLQWKLTNRNKQCITLDIAQTDGRALLEQLLARADLLVSNMPAARLRAWALDADALRARHPTLVAVNLTTYGITGSWADRAGSGTLAEAVTGLAHLTGAADAPPTLSPVGLGDGLGVLHGIVAALTGMLLRQNGGRSFDLSMTEPLLGVLSQRLAQVARTGTDPGRRGNRFPTTAPRNTYCAADGRWIAISAGTDALVARLFEVMGQPELREDPRFQTNVARLANVDALDGFIDAWVAARPAAIAVQALIAARVSAAAVDDIPAVLANPHFRERGEIVTFDDHEIGRIVTAKPGIGDLGAMHHLGRALVGADNDAIYREWLGIEPTELANLRSAGII
jgi:crotonobetainyl-CoA:carnitine CoA-transferase CaiB-like acyl-CoA transferase